MKKIIITAAVVLLLLGDEVLAWAALDVLAVLGVGRLLKADFEQNQSLGESNHGKNGWT